MHNLIHIYLPSGFRLVWPTLDSGQLALVLQAPGMWSPHPQWLTPHLGSLVLTYLSGQQLLLGATWCLPPSGALEVASMGGVVQSAGWDYCVTRNFSWPRFPLSQTHRRPRLGPAKHQRGEGTRLGLAEAASKPSFVWSAPEFLLSHVEARLWGWTGASPILSSLPSLSSQGL